MKIYDNVAAQVCKEFSISMEELKGESRKQKIVFARHAFFYLMRLLKCTTIDIGEYANRHHTTVVNSHKVAKQLISQFPHYNYKIKRIKSILHSYF